MARLSTRDHDSVLGREGEGEGVRGEFVVSRG